MVNRSLTKTVLIIEDEADIRKFASRVLELEGYHVLQVEDSNQDLRLAREGRISLVLLDLRLPGDDGWAVLRHTRFWDERTEPAFHSHDLIIDIARHRVTVGGQEVRLTATEYRLMSYLARNADCIVTPCPETCKTKKARALGIITKGGLLEMNKRPCIMVMTRSCCTFPWLIYRHI